MTSPGSSPPPFWPYQRELETERRLTTVEITTERHAQKLESHEQRHDTQDAWNKGVAIALLGLASGLAHAKAASVVEFARGLLRGLKP